MRGSASSKPCPPDVRPGEIKRRTRAMIVLGADTHKRSHTVAAVAATTGELLGEQTVQVGRRGFDALLRWARGLDGERVWALEDCRHVSGSLERFLIGRGERVLRMPTHLTTVASSDAACGPLRGPKGAADTRSRAAWWRTAVPAPRERDLMGPASAAWCAERWPGGSAPPGHRRGHSLRTAR